MSLQSQIQDITFVIPGDDLSCFRQDGYLVKSASFRSYASSKGVHLVFAGLTMLKKRLIIVPFFCSEAHLFDLASSQQSDRAGRKSFMETSSMTRLTSQYWGMVLGWGVLVVIFGLCALFLPHLTLLTLIYLFGIFALANGILGIVTAIQDRHLFPFWGLRIGAGIVSVLFGLATIVWPHITALIALYLIASWAIVTGIFQLASAFSGLTTQPPWFMALAGIVAILLGIVLFVSSPLVALFSLVWVIGLYALIYGGILIARAFQLRAQSRVKNREPEFFS
jgi:uncharacterized membrane protein HdeD (DUF308 family)